MSVAWWRDYDPKFVQDRSDVQVQLIKDAFEKAGVPIAEHRDDDGMVDYMYRPGVVLTRDVDAGRVHRALGLSDVPDKSDERGPLQPAGLHVVQLPDAREVVEALEELDRRLGVGVATPDHLIHVTDGQKVTWCMSKEPAQPVADAVPTFNTDDESDGRSGLVVVVDTGSLREVIEAHDWLANVTGEEEDANTVGHYTGHGTFVAGVVRQYAPAAEVTILRILSVGGANFESAVADGLTKALDLAPDVINLSAGTRTRRDLPLLSFEVFWEQRLSHLKGTVLVAAAGNDGNRGPFWPAAFPWVVSAGALDFAGRDRAGFSNHGSWVDVYALGTDVVNAYPEGPYTYREPPLTDQTTSFPGGVAAWSGTSFAAPMVAGLTVARMTWSGESAQGSVDSLLRIARANAGVGVGARLTSGADATRASNIP